jgi:Arc/MetJ-type ribon-helix-helix transcriptional regulator
MPIINFSIPPALLRQIEELMKKKGFASKAEFCRYLMHMYIDLDEGKEEQSTAALTAEMEKALQDFDWNSVPTLEEQLADL